jgi:hypothetical protein
MTLLYLRRKMLAEMESMEQHLDAMGEFADQLEEGSPESRSE